MLKQNRWKILITSVVTIIPMMVGCILWPQLPDTIATHFGVDNTANGWSSKAVAVFGIPAFLVLLHLFCLIVTSVDPKMKNIGRKPLGLIFWICPSISLITGAVIYARALNVEVDVGLICQLFLGVLFIAIGNYLPKCRQNYSFGIKVPWTLDDPENWSRTHRLAGWCFIVTGVLTMAISFLRLPWLFFSLVIASVLMPFFYSYLYYRKKKSGRL